MNNGNGREKLATLEALLGRTDMPFVKGSRIEEVNVLAQTPASTGSDSEKLAPGVVGILVVLVIASGVMRPLVLLSWSMSCDKIRAMNQSHFEVTYLE